MNLGRFLFALSKKWSSPHLVCLHPCYVVVLVVRGLEEDAGVEPLQVDPHAVAAVHQIAQGGVSHLQGNYDVMRTHCST